MKRQTRDDIQTVCDLVVATFDVPEDVICKDSRHLPHVMARWALWHLCVWWKRVDSQDLADWTGHERGTVNIALRRIKNDLDTNARFKAKVDAIAYVLGNVHSQKSPYVSGPPSDHPQSELRQEIFNDDR